MAYYVYILRSSSHPSEIYIGCTHDIKSRIDEHNAGGSPHTSKFMPWELVIFVRFREQAKAFEFERYLKSGSGRAFASKHFL